ncbi:MAG: PDZ domain-containing protein [Armatimonadetes bacterium]|nr:PDZ domain-containing protein [Armatimonadota bacterium]
MNGTAAGRTAPAKERICMYVKRLAIVFSLVLAMAAGFAARTYTSHRNPEELVLKSSRMSRPIAAYAPNAAVSDVGARTDVDLHPLETFYLALQHLRDDYVEPIQKPQERDMSYASLRAMLDSLHDPLTRFLGPDEAQVVQEARVGKFHGIGAVIEVKQEVHDDIAEELLVITTTIPGSPAHQAGLMTGDVIMAVDGKSILPYDPYKPIDKLIKATRNGQVDREKLPKLLEAENERIKNGIGFQKAADMLAGKGSKEFTLTVARPGAKDPLAIKLKAASTTIDPVAYSTLNQSVGYIRVNMIAESAESQVNDAIGSFKQKGLKGLVLDLRDSPGGAIESAQKISGHFIPGKTLSILKLPGGKQRTLKAAAMEAGVWEGPVAVLANAGTSGLSEVLAAAIRDGAGAKVVGGSTSGDTLQQTLVPLRDGSAVTITTGKYLTPRGADYKDRGLTPDVPVAGGGKPGEDTQLARAVELLTSGKARG